ncbi:MAG: hypothetical protein JWO86_7522 [Myxococcaceae bacterium]|nr:hypothetical protein [Myxococcaceae bacterium]
MRAAAVPALLLVVAAGIGGCGETRRPIGDECLRSDDCLSGVCSDKTCVAAPTLVTGAGPPPADEVPRVPIVDGGASGGPTDAASGGG